MRLIRNITSEEENFRLEGEGQIKFIKRDPVKPEPEGTIILIPYRIVEYDSDCDGSLMARVESISLDDLERDDFDDMSEIQGLSMQEFRKYSGCETNWGLYPESGFVVTKEELVKMWKEPLPEPPKPE